MSARLSIEQALATARHHKARADELASAIRAHRLLAHDRGRSDASRASLLARERRADAKLYAALDRVDPTPAGGVGTGTVPRRTRLSGA